MLQQVARGGGWFESYSNEVAVGYDRREAEGLPPLAVGVLFVVEVRNEGE